MKNALIIGSGGIGSTLAEFLSIDYRIFLTYRKKQPKIESYAYQIDLTDKSTWKHLLEDLETYEIKFDLVVNSSGIYHDDPLLQTDSNEFFQVLNVNLLAFNDFLAEIIPFLKKNAIILLMGSDAGISFQPNHAVYSISKWAQFSYAENLAYEMADKKIIYAVLGNVNTKLTPISMPTAAEAKTIAKLLKEYISHEDKLKNNKLNLAFFGTGEELDYTVTDLLEKIVEISNNFHSTNETKHSTKDILNFFMNLLKKENHS